MIGIIAVSLAASWHVQRVDFPGNPQRIVVVDGTSVVGIDTSDASSDGEPVRRRSAGATKTVTLSSIRLDGEHAETHVFPAIDGAPAYMPRLDRIGAAPVSMVRAGPHVLVLPLVDAAGVVSLWAVTSDAPPRLLTHIAADVDVSDVIANDGGVLVVELPKQSAKVAAADHGDDVGDKKPSPAKARVSYVDVDSGEVSDLGIAIDGSAGIQCSAKAALCAYVDGTALMTVERGKEPRRLLKNGCSEDCALSLSPDARFIALGRLVVDRIHPERSTYLGAMNDWHTSAPPKHDVDAFCSVWSGAWLDDDHLEVNVDQRPSEECFRDPPKCRAKDHHVVVDVEHATRRRVVDDDPWTPLPCGIEHRTGSVRADCMGSVEQWSPGKGREPVSLALSEDTALVFGDRRRAYAWHAANAKYDAPGTPVALDAASIVHFRQGGVDVTPAVVRGFSRVEATLDDDWLVLAGGGRRAFEDDADAVQPSPPHWAPVTPLRFAVVRVTPDDAR